MGRIQGDLLERTMEFAVAIMRLVDQLPNSPKGWTIARQLLKSATSIGANIREANHALSDADFAYTCNVARKEASETHYWLELSRRTEVLHGPELESALREVVQDRA